MPMFAMVVIIGRGIVGAGADKKCAAEKKRDQGPFSEAVPSALCFADRKFRWHQSRIAVTPRTKNAFIHITIALRE